MALPHIAVMPANIPERDAFYENFCMFRRVSA
jgi:hypothetical protein